MHIATPIQACKVVKKITDRGIFLCLKPADVVLSLNVPEMTVLCSDCARQLAREIRNSLPGARQFGRSFERQRRTLTNREKRSVNGGGE